ncbi:MAG TPA: glycosyltransferase family 4 protein [Syntrophomonadaceae bacterium]|nr:glycosyltransferase family 4 protein [Syntrophomonadaceae bacterium]
MKIALLSPIAWRTPPRHYGPWERVVSLLAEGLINQGVDVTLFATGDSLTRGTLKFRCPVPWEENKHLDAKVWESLHISYLFEQAGSFDLIHNHYDFLPLTYSRLVHTPLVTTIHGFSSSRILPVYREYNRDTDYVSISYADRHPDLDYVGNVYHGIDLESFEYQAAPGSYLLYFGRIHPDKGTREAIDIALRCGQKLYLAGIIQDKEYFNQQVAPFIDNQQIFYLGSVGPAQRNTLLGSAKALLHPIHFNEPFGLSVIEAMACGTPVIAFKRGSMPEVIADGVSGYLVDNLNEACEKVDLIDRLCRKDCRHWVEERFSQSRMVQDYLALYKQILDRPGAGIQHSHIDGYTCEQDYS